MRALYRATWSVLLITLYNMSGIPLGGPFTKSQGITQSYHARESKYNASRDRIIYSILLSCHSGLSTHCYSASIACNAQDQGWLVHNITQTVIQLHGNVMPGTDTTLLWSSDSPFLLKKLGPTDWLFDSASTYSTYIREVKHRILHSVINIRGSILYLWHQVKLLIVDVNMAATVCLRSYSICMQCNKIPTVVIVCAFMWQYSYWMGSSQ